MVWDVGWGHSCYRIIKDLASGILKNSFIYERKGFFFSFFICLNLKFMMENPIKFSNFYIIL